MTIDGSVKSLDTREGDGAAGAATFKANFVYETLKRRILDGVYAPGDWLRLSQLAREFSLSEMPIREALRILQADGLVVLHLHRGAQVAQLSLARGYEIVETRLYLERAAALSAAPFHTPESQRAMAASIRAMQALTQQPREFALQNRRFCSLLFEPSPNRFMVSHIQDLWDQVWQHSTTLIYRFLGDRIADSIDENRRILVAVETRDLRQFGTVFDDRIRLTLEAWRRAGEAYSVS